MRLFSSPSYKNHSKNYYNHFSINYLALLIGSVIFLVTASVDAKTPEDDIDTLINTYHLREAAVALRDTKGWLKPKKIIIRVDNKERLKWFKEVIDGVELVGVAQADEAVKHIHDADALLGFCSEDLIQKSQRLKWVQTYWVGVDRCLETDILKKKDVLLSNSKRLSGSQIAEHAIALMFSLTRGLDQYQVQQQKSQWSRTVLPGDEAIWELSGRTMLVVGLGGIGSEIAQRGHALGMKVIATRSSSRKGPDYVSYVGLADELLTLAAKADVVINALPLTASTTNIFNKEFFKVMKRQAYFISIGRGKSTNTDDLLMALKDGELAGAGLDVTDPEPLPDNHPLWKQPRVIITPHVAWRSDKYSKRRWLMIRENLRRYINGEALLSLVDLNKGY